MTSINDLQERINSAEKIFNVFKSELDELKAQAQEQPEPASLLGRWATHPTYGRGSIVSIKPDGDGEVRFAYRNGSYTDGVDTRFVRLEYLDLDPATLNTAKDFENAPEDTIVEELERYRTVHMKVGEEWRPIGENDYQWSHDMFPCRVIRWGENR